jgi:hypothetical protein
MINAAIKMASHVYPNSNIFHTQRYEKAREKKKQ